MTDQRLGRSVTVAIDHGLHWGSLEGFEDPAALLDTVLDAGPDGILASVPFLKRFEDRIDAADVHTIGTLDLLYDSTMPGDIENAEIHSQVFSVEDCADVADAAKVALVFGREDPDVLKENAEFVAAAAEECDDAGIPLIVEPTLWGQRADDEFDTDYLVNANRLGFELGADILKTPYPPTGFERIVDNAPVPTYIAGGPTVETDREVLEMVHGAVEAGSQGVMFGRNVWQRDDPAAIIDALSAIVHEGATIEEAETLL
ncbi:class I fructose-bisphosphate aldolase [Haloferax denitrificans]|uniref:fructose-bisphosphate aldolase n=1 Tax=Haloferax denitrificans ATCC 35960 TaxID=662478 RepID=M0JKJ6_9EURY|nr:fructose-1,6-bisphosphate aldolase of the DhnA family protein [Haloferax denitrificans ATCC 35960]